MILRHNGQVHGEREGGGAEEWRPHKDPEPDLAEELRAKELKAGDGEAPVLRNGLTPLPITPLPHLKRFMERGEVKGGFHPHNDHEPAGKCKLQMLNAKFGLRTLPGQQFVYGFDDIGNRDHTWAGGNDSGTQMRYASYTVNSPNQITMRDVPGAADIVGVAYASSDVTVNDSPAYRWREYFRDELDIDNASGPVYTSITNIASYGGMSETNSGNLLLPPSTESFTYDANGNLTSDGIWTNIWNGENRLVLTETLSDVPDEAKRKLAFTYDYQGRRVSKVVSNWTGGSWQFEYERNYLYDAWNLVAEFDEDSAWVR